ncbi:MAG: aldehyde dehydrogenase (NADP(+)) [Bacteroidota bacterium]
MITGENYIGGQRSAKGDSTYTTFDPKLNLPTEWTFYEATEEEINEAVEKGQSAFKVFQNIPGTERAVFLRAIAEEIEGLGDDLLAVYMRESGLPEGRAKGERGRTMGQLKAFADLLEEGSWVEAIIDTAQPDRQPLPKVDIRKMLVPLGPIAVFGSSNFPFAFSTAGGDAASALAAGCPVVVKGHPMHTGTSEMVASAIIAAALRTGMPDGVFSHLNSSGIQVGQKLVMHPGIKGVGFTGSIKGGTALYQLASERKEPIPVFAEMGSINPVVILPGALGDKAAQWASSYAGSITLGTGQFCTNPGLLLGIKSGELDSFTSILGQELEKQEPGCMLHSNIHAGYEKGKEELSSQPNTQIMASYEAEVAPNYAKQRILKVSGADFKGNPKLHQEVFGPFSIVVECRDKEELQQLIQQLEGQLTGTILGNNEEVVDDPDIVEALKSKVGRLIFNGVPTGVEVCPAMQHGGPFPASTDSRFTSVGTSAIKRWVRPVTYQNWPQEALPEALKSGNPLGIMRLVDGRYSAEKI